MTYETQQIIKLITELVEESESSRAEHELARSQGDWSDATWNAADACVRIDCAKRLYRFFQALGGDPDMLPVNVRHQLNQSQAPMTKRPLPSQLLATLNDGSQGWVPIRQPQNA